jgi:hypothetical protein
MLALLLACAPKPTATQTATGYTNETGASVDLGVQDFLTRTEPKIIDCYMKTLADPSQADDSVQLQYVIDGAGKVTRVVARQSSITDVRFMSCVEEVMAMEKVVNENGHTIAVARDYTFRPAPSP